MPDLTSDDGYTITGVPNGIAIDDPRVQAQFGKLRSAEMNTRMHSNGSGTKLPPGTSAPQQTITSQTESPTTIPQGVEPNQDPGLTWFIAHGGKAKDYSTADDIPRGIVKGMAPTIVGGGLGALAGPEGIIPGIGAANMIMGGADLAQTGFNATGIPQVQAPTPSQKIDQAAPTMTPEGRIAQSGAEGVSSALGMGGTGKVLEQAGTNLSGALAGTGLAESTAPALLQRTGQVLQAGQTQNVVGSATGNIAGQTVQENGGSPLQSALASLGTGAAASLAMSTPQMMKNLLERTPTQQQQLIEDAKNLGNADLMTRDVFQPQGGFAKLFDNFSKNNPFGPIQGRINGQQAIDRTDAAKSVLQSFGVPSADDTLANSFADFRSQQLSKYTKQKADVLNALDQTGKPVPMTNTTTAIDAALAKLEGLNNPSLNSGIASLKSLRQGIVGGTPDVDTLMQSYVPGSGVPGANLGPNNYSQTINKIEANRQIFRATLSDADFAVKSQLQKVSGPIKDAINKDMGSFIQANGQPGDVEKWSGANAKLSDMMGDFKNSSLSSMLNKGEGDVNTAQRLLFSDNSVENKMLFDGLTPQGKESAKSVIMSKVLSDAIDPKTQILDPTQVSANLTKNMDQLGIYLGPQEQERIRGLQNYLTATIPPPGVDHNSSFLYSHVLPQLVVNGLAAAAGGAVGAHEAGPLGGVTGAVAGAASIGTLSGLYNSAPVRNLLVTLSKATKGSLESQNAIRRLNTIFSQNHTSLLQGHWQNQQTESPTDTPQGEQ